MYVAFQKRGNLFTLTFLVLIPAPWWGGVYGSEKNAETLKIEKLVETLPPNIPHMHIYTLKTFVK